MAALGLAAALHLPLLWVQLQRAANDEEPTQLVELLLTPPEPIAVSPPSEWADALELKWTLGAQPDPTENAPQFDDLQGLDSGKMALSAQLTGFSPPASSTPPREVTRATQAPPASQAQPPRPVTSQAAEQTATPLQAPEQTAPTPPSSETALSEVDAAIDAALAGTQAVRTPQPLPDQTQDITAAERQATAPNDAVARALQQTPAVRTPGALPEAAQALLDRPVPAASEPEPEPPVPLRAQPRPQQAPTQDDQANQRQAQAEDRYNPNGPAGSYSSDRNAFFSNLAEHLFTVNDQRLRARPYNSRQIVDVRFSIDRQGRVMRVWTPAPVQSAATDAAKAMIWAASPVPQLSPDMPQAVLELTFPVIVGQ